MKVVDTTFLIDLVNGVEETKNVINSKEMLLTTQINTYELIRGLFIRGHSWDNVFLVQEMLENIRVLPLDDDGIIRAADIFAKLRKQGTMLPDGDCLTAGIALSKGITTIVTRNIKDFKRIKGITPEYY
jgi:tRNA(fMet)-specific endonuclease VapC